MTTTFMRSGLGALTAAVLLAAPAFAASVNLKADLKSSNEVPPVDSKGSGSVTATFDTARKQLSWKGRCTALSGPPTARNSHSAEPGKNGAVVVPFFPDGAEWKCPAESGKN